MRKLGFLFFPFIIAIALLFVSYSLVIANSLDSTNSGENLPKTSLQIDANYAHDWVAGVTDPGVTVLITVTDQAGVLKSVGCTVYRLYLGPLCP